MRKQLAVMVLLLIAFFSLASCGDSGTAAPQKAVDEKLLSGFGQPSQKQCEELLELGSEDWGKMSYSPGDGYRKKLNWCGYDLDTDLGFANGMPTAIQAVKSFGSQEEAASAGKACFEAMKEQLGAPASIAQYVVADNHESGETNSYSDGDESAALQWLLDQTGESSYVQFNFPLREYVQEGEDGEKYLLHFSIGKSESKQDEMSMSFLIVNLNHR